MKTWTQKRSAIGVSTWVSLLLLLASNPFNLLSSEATAVEATIDESGEIENLGVDSELPIDGTNEDSTKKTRLDLANAQFDWLLSKGRSLLLESSPFHLLFSEAANVETTIDTSGEIENLGVDIELPVDGTNKDSTKKTRLDLANAQFDWLLSKGGSVDLEKVAFFDSDGEENSDSTNLGVFAVNDIDDGDVLIRIPNSLTLATGTCTKIVFRL